MKFRRSAALTALTAGLITAIPATAADAAAAPIVAGGSFARTAPFIDGIIVSYECHAAAPGAVSTTIDSCNLYASASVIPAPPAVSTAEFAVSREAVAVPAVPYHVCWTASARYGDGTTQATSGCTTTSPIAGAG